VTVQVADGLEVQRGSGWLGVDAGDDLPADATVRLSSGGYAEIARGDRVVTLSRAGTYRLPDLLQAAGAASSWGISSVMGSKLGALASGTRGAGTQAAQMGVRGAAQGGGTVTWVEDEAGEMVKQGLALLEQGNSSDALAAFQKASESATDGDTEQAARFYQAYTSDALGQRAQALRILAKLTPRQQADYYGDFVLLKGRLLIESAAAADALPLLDSYLAANPKGDGAQAAQILASFACRALGDTRSAAVRLEQARDLAPGSDLAQKATTLLAQIQ
jgi:hypothetical protein